MPLAEPARRALERPRLLIGVAIVLFWVTCLVVALRADGLDVDARGLAAVGVLGPLAIAAAYSIAAHVGGVALGAWALLVWVALPWLAPAFTLASYDATLRDNVLPLVLGLTGAGGYAEGVAALVALALLLRRRREAAAAGAILLAGLAVLWLTRLPIPELSADAFKAAMAGVREYFWSHRVLQWIPIAGVVAVARRSTRTAAALGGWLGGYVVFRAAQPGVGLAEGELFRALLPALPAYVLLASALPLLVPTLVARLGPLARPAEAP
jgi:hypothetical protein